MAFTTPTSRLVLALDVADVASAERLVEATRGAVGVYKIGFELALSGGIALAGRLAAEGEAVFLDMKLLDIANTVTAATRAASRLGVRFLTVHAYPQALRAAVAGRAEGLSVVAVTVLTSMDDGDLAEAGYAAGADDLVARRVDAARAAGADAIVCAPAEAAIAARSGLAVITPGVRLPQDGAGDQKRIATPQEAIAAGADALVVGRPIAMAPAPHAAALRYADAIAEGLARRHDLTPT